MKITIPTRHLDKALQQLKPIPGSRNRSLPILGNALFETGESQVTITATDTDKRFSIVVSCAVNKPGQCTLPLNRLSELVKNYAASETKIDWNGKQAVVSAGETTAKIYGLPAEEFPEDFTLDVKTSFKIEASDLKKCLDRASSHASRDSSRGIYNSVLIRTRDKKVTFEAGHPGQAIIVDSGVESDAGIYSIIALDSIPGMSAMDSTVTVDICENAIAIKSNNASFKSKVIEGSLFDFAKAFPDFSTSIKATFNREELTAVIERAKILTSELSPGVKITCTDARLSVESNTKDVGELEDNIKALSECEDFSFGISPSFLLAALKATDGETADIYYSGELKPICIKDETAMCAISAIRIE